MPQAYDDVDWFKDVESTGGVVEQHIGKLAARCFEDDRLQASSLRTAYEDAHLGHLDDDTKSVCLPTRFSDSAIRDSPTLSSITVASFPRSSC